jgi:Protein of unknown function (DUF3723)
MTYSALLKAQKPKEYKYNKAVFKDFIEQIADIFSIAQRLIEEEEQTIILIDLSNKPLKRYKILYKKDYKQNKSSLFLY